MSDLSQYDAEFAPGENARRPGAETLPDGDYEFTIREAVLGVSRKKEQPFVRFTLAHGGGVVDYIHNLTTQTGANILGGILIVLGIPCDQWAAEGRLFSVELPFALRAVRGAVVQCKKETDSNDARYARVYFNQLISSGVGYDGQEAGSDDIPF